MGPQGLEPGRAVRSHGRGLDLRRGLAQAEARVTWTTP
jgi:hypothetical protein